MKFSTIIPLLSFTGVTAAPIGFQRGVYNALEAWTNLAEAAVRMQLEVSNAKLPREVSGQPQTWMTKRAVKHEKQFAYLYQSQKHWNLGPPPKSKVKSYYQIVKEAARKTKFAHGYTKPDFDGHCLALPRDASDDDKANNFVQNLHLQGSNELTSPKARAVARYNYQKLSAQIAKVQRANEYSKSKISQHAGHFKRKVSKLLATQSEVGHDVHYFAHLADQRSMWPYTKRSPAPVHLAEAKQLIHRILHLALVTWFDNQPKFDPTTMLPVWKQWKTTTWQPYASVTLPGKTFAQYEIDFLTDVQNFMNIPLPLAGNGKDIPFIQEMFSYLTHSKNPVDEFLLELVQMTRLLCQGNGNHNKRVAGEFINKKASVLTSIARGWKARWDDMESTRRGWQGRHFWVPEGHKFSWE